MGYKLATVYTDVLKNIKDGATLSELELRDKFALLTGITNPMTQRDHIDRMVRLGYLKIDAQGKFKKIAEIKVETKVELKVEAKELEKPKV